MKTTAMVSTLLLTLVATLGVAAADDSASVTASRAEDARVPSKAYFSTGLMMGGDDQVFFAGVGLDGGYRVGDGPMWIHAAVIEGQPQELFSRTVGGNYTQAHAGVEMRQCTVHGGACAAAGVDMGYRYMDYEGRGGLFSDDDSMTTAHSEGIVAVPRVQFDYGGDTFRLRHSFEAVVADKGATGMQVGLALVVQM